MVFFFLFFFFFGNVKDSPILNSAAKFPRWNNSVTEACYLIGSQGQSLRFHPVSCEHRRMGYWGLPWLSNSHSTREEFLKGPGGLCLAVFCVVFFFLVVSFILEFFKQNISEKFSCLTFYSNLLKQRQVRNKLKIYLVKHTHTQDPPLYFSAKNIFSICCTLGYLWISQLYV